MAGRMTSEEKAWIAFLVDYGCVLCKWEWQLTTPPQIHHMLSGGRRMGHLWTLPLCFSHHDGGINNAQIVSRGHSLRRWENRYAERFGTEREILERLRAEYFAKVRMH